MAKKKSYRSLWCYCHTVFSGKGNRNRAGALECECTEAGTQAKISVKGLNIIQRRNGKKGGK